MVFDVYRKAIRIGAVPCQREKQVLSPPGRDEYFRARTLPCEKTLEIYLTLPPYNRKRGSRDCSSTTRPTGGWHHVDPLFPWAGHMGRRQRDRVVRALDSQSGGPGFESRSGHLLDLYSVVPCSNPRPRL